MNIITEKLKKISGSLSGKSVVEKVGEYSEVYGEVLFGITNENRLIHKKLESLSKIREELDSLSKKIEKTGNANLEKKLSSLEENIKTHLESVQKELLIIKIVLFIACTSAFLAWYFYA